MGGGRVKLDSILFGLWLTLWTNAIVAQDAIFANSFDPPQATCPNPVYPVRQVAVNTKFGTKPGTYLVDTEPKLFNDNPTTPTEQFPQTGNRAVTFAVNANQYVALPFVVPTDLSARFAAKIGMFDTNYLGAPPFASSISYSISQCPGDFNVPSECKKSWNGADGDYLTFGAPELSIVCKLERGKTYYINVINADLVSLTNKCLGTTCAVSLSYNRLQ